MEYLSQPGLNLKPGSRVGQNSEPKRYWAWVGIELWLGLEPSPGARLMAMCRTRAIVYAGDWLA
jgi:hypothetical protein